MIPYGRQNITDDDINAVVDVLRSDFLTQGPTIPRFEKALCEAVGAKHGVAVNSATSALHIACLALGAAPGTIVWTSPISFVASSNCALYCGADIDFVDIDPDTFNMCPKALENKLKAAKENGTLPRIVIPVHMCGQPCDMEAIHALSQEYGFSIVEDASHAVGATYHGTPVGDCRYSDVCVFSFHPVKIVTTAEGGVCMTNNDELATQMGLLRSHGVTRNPDLMVSESHGPWYYQQVALGLNYRMTELQAALGVSQMTRLREFVDQRNHLADRYDERLKDLPLLTPPQLAETRSSRHLYIIRLKLDEISLSHREVFEALRENGIGVNLHYIPIHTQPFYRDLGFKDGDFPNAEAYYTQAISIPLYHGMSDEQQDTVVDVLRRTLGLNS